MILKETYGYRVALERPDGTICERRFSGLTTANRWVDTMQSYGIVPAGNPYRVFFYGSAHSVPLRCWDSGSEIYSLELAGEIAELQYPGLWSAVCN